ncbi:hypothetical protein K0M31_003009 [Melipona bicolor]|uniref:Uncharacterized protein n=1 Tax=Melipona bicolor TaxID=60889 RepID=A0AA40KQ18_9HYME|nr:hypothetical protein K0M31_003009 [Melipona bicolor]
MYEEASRLSSSKLATASGALRRMSDVPVSCGMMDRPIPSQYAVLRAECGKLVSMHQIGVRRKPKRSARVYRIQCNAPMCPASFSWSGSCHPSRDHAAAATPAILHRPYGAFGHTLRYTGHAFAIFRSPFGTERIDIRTHRTREKLHDATDVAVYLATIPDVFLQGGFFFITESDFRAGVTQKIGPL